MSKWLNQLKWRLRLAWTVLRQPPAVIVHSGTISVPVEQKVAFPGGALLHGSMTFRGTKGREK